jgi:flavin reductase (DIM6/NTAB) family NADH-FMN oxidoreductase RutF
MNRKTVPFSYQFEETMRQLGSDGLLLAATKPSGGSNLMTIGWGALGLVWGLPTFVVLVRPSRFTYEFIEAAGEFTVNVPTPAMSDMVLFCGSQSGRDVDKIARFGLRVSRGHTVQSVTLDACPLVYECRVVQKNDILPGSLDAGILARFYPGGDFHRAYYGEILGTFAADPE